MIVTLVFFITFALFFLSNVYKLWKLRNQPPGPWGFPIFGYLPFLDRIAPYKTLQQLSTKYGPIYRVQLGNINTIVLADANAVREFLRRDEFTARAPLFITHGIMGGYGLICSEGPLWKDQRRQTIGWLRNLGMIRKACAERSSLESSLILKIQEFLKSIQEDSSENKELNPLNHLFHTFGNIMSGLVLGVTYTKNDPTWKYLQGLQEEGVKYMGVSGIVNFLPFLRFLPSQKQIINFLLKGKAQTHHIYDQYIAEFEATLNNRTPSSILDYFLLEKEKRKRESDVNVEKFFCQEQLRHLLADLFGAGLDTSVTTIRWLILYMAKYSHCQKILQKELSGLARNNLKLCDLENIDYLKACISETQRIRSVVPLGLPHGTVKDTVMNGFTITKNSMIIPLLWAIHMNPDIWPNPEEFNPNRFLDSDGKHITPSGFIPFQTGKRMCPGEELARILIILFTGILFRNFEIQLPKSAVDICDMEGECGITLTPKNYNVIFKEIDI